MKNTKRLRKATPARLGLKVAEPVTGGLLVTAYPLVDGRLEHRPVLSTLGPHHHQRPGGSVMRP